MYVSLDGVFRFYVPFLILLFSFLSYRTLGELFSKTFDFVFERVYKILDLALYYLIKPLFISILFVKKRIIALINPISVKYGRIRSQKIINNKKKEAVRFLK